MDKFNHNIFDKKLLYKLIDMGIQVSTINYKRYDQKYDTDPSIIKRSFSVSGTEHYFIFEIDMDNYESGNTEELYAYRAAYKIRDILQPWYYNQAVYVENYLDNLNFEGKE